MKLEAHGSRMRPNTRRAVLSWALLCGFSVSVSGCGDRRAEELSREGLQSINGTELFVKRVGNGEPIVLVHGGPMLDHGYLLPHVSALADEYELIFYDQRLSGRSAPRVDSASVRIDTFVEDIEQLRRSLGLERVHLVAHSWGGLLAMRYAIRHQENLQSLVLLNSMSASSEIWQEEERRLAQRVTAADSIERQAIRESQAFANREPDAIARMLRLSFRLQFHDPALVDDLQLYVPDDYADRSRQFGYMMGDLMDFDLHRELEAVTVPTLIIYGATEPAAESSGPLLHERFPNSELVIIESAGHFPFIEQPEELLNLVRSFLERR